MKYSLKDWWDILGGWKTLAVLVGSVLAAAWLLFIWYVIIHFVIKFW